MQRCEILNLMAIISSEYGDRFQSSSEKLELWGNILGHATYLEAQKAVISILGSKAQFPPTVGEINHKILEARTGAQALDWASEWERVLKASANSSYGAVAEALKLEPQTLKAVGGLSGLKELGSLSFGEMSTFRAQFRQRFEMLATKGIEREFREYIEDTAKKLINGGKNGLLEM